LSSVLIAARRFTLDPSLKQRAMFGFSSDRPKYREQIT